LKANNYSIYSSGDQSVTVSFGDVMDMDINQKVQCLYRHMAGLPNPFWKDIMPAYSSLTVVYDVVAIRRIQPSAREWMIKEVEEILTQCNFSIHTERRAVSIPVWYDSLVAPDLKKLMLERKLSLQEIIVLHTEKVYRVFMIGFLPGFAYMGEVDDRLVSPRLASPRKHVVKGSVGIAGNQTGIYPLDSPGGWNIVGRTPLQLFNPGASFDTDHGALSVLFQPGDEVKFYAISKEEFEYLSLEKFDPHIR